MHARGSIARSHTAFVLAGQHSTQQPAHCTHRNNQLTALTPTNQLTALTQQPGRPCCLNTQRAPYHVDALLAMADLYAHMGEAGYAEEVLAQ